MHTATNKGRVPKKFLPMSMSGTQLSCFLGPNFGLNWQMRQKKIRLQWPRGATSVEHAPKPDKTP